MPLQISLGDERAPVCAVVPRFERNVEDDLLDPGGGGEPRSIGFDVEVCRSADPSPFEYVFSGRANVLSSTLCDRRWLDDALPVDDKGFEPDA